MIVAIMLTASRCRRTQVNVNILWDIKMSHRHHGACVYIHTYIHTYVYIIFFLKKITRLGEKQTCHNIDFVRKKENRVSFKTTNIEKMLSTYVELV